MSEPFSNLSLIFHKLIYMQNSPSSSDLLGDFAFTGIKKSK